MELRDLTEADKPALKAWLEKAHGDRIKPEIFFEAGRKGKVAEDSRGPVFFVLLTEATRVDIQFDPFAENGYRTAKGLALLNDDLRGKELVTESVAVKFMGFLGKMGFTREPETFARKL